MTPREIARATYDTYVATLDATRDWTARTGAFDAAIDATRAATCDTYVATRAAARDATEDR